MINWEPVLEVRFELKRGISIAKRNFFLDSHSKILHKTEICLMPSYDLGLKVLYFTIIKESTKNVLFYEKM